MKNKQLQHRVHFNSRVNALIRNTLSIFLLCTCIYFKGSSQEQSGPIFMEITKLKKSNDDMMDVQEELVKPFVQQRIKQGNQLVHALFKVVYPQSDDAAYDYVILDVYEKFEHINLGREKMMEMANLAFPSADLPLMMERFEASAHHESSEVFVWRDEAFPGPQGGSKSIPQFVQVNSMKVSESNASAYAKLESDVFKPIHQARAKAGSMYDWIMAQKILPYGSEYDNNFLTFDIFNSWADISKGNMAAFFAEVHPDKNPEKVFSEIAQLRDLKRSETWELISIVDSPTPEVTFEIVEQGVGALPKKGQEITWKGILKDKEGNQLFNTNDLGFDFHHIVGGDPYDRFFDKGMRQMKKGGKLKIHVPTAAQDDQIQNMTGGKDAVMHLEIVDINDLKPDGTKMLAEMIEVEGLDAVKKMYTTIRTNDPNKYIFRENKMNALGYRLMEVGNHDAAIYVFELNHKNYPKSWNACDSLADGYAANGNMNKAKKYYSMALEINPDFQAAKDKLAALGK